MFQENLIQDMINPMEYTIPSLYPNLRGKTVVITGATSGIGLAAAKAFAAEGAMVIGMGRSQERIDQAETHIKVQTPDAKVQTILADLSSQHQIRSAAAAIKTLLNQTNQGPLDILINNAGTYASCFIPTSEGYETIFAVNHLSPFLLTHELLPNLARSTFGKVLTVSSGSHYRTWLNIRRAVRPVIFNGLWAYKVSKLANVLFTLEFNQRYAGLPVRAFAVDPGLVSTDIGSKNTDWISKVVWTFRRHQGTSPEIPVRTLLHLSNDDSLYNTKDIYWHNSRPKTPSCQSQRRTLAKQLWDASLMWCGIEEEQEIDG